MRWPAAVADVASPAARAHGAEAAKTLHTLLAAVPGTPLTPPTPSALPLGQMVQQIKGTPQTVVLDALIAKLASYLPDESKAAPSSGLRVPFVPLVLKGMTDES